MKTVLITGVSGGIGMATAKVFITDGWRVIGIDQYLPDESIENLNFIKGDVSSPASTTELFNEIAAMVDKLDAVVNNAALQLCKSIVETETVEWDQVMDTNVRSVYLLARHAYNMMCKSGGAIVNISSVHAIATSQNIAAYATSKGAMLAMTRAMALEFAPNNIRVNAVLPGAVDTSMLRDGLSRSSFGKDTDADSMNLLADRTPLGRIGQPREIAQAILFLADNNRSSFITGQALVVDGGAVARLSTE